MKPNQRSKPPRHRHQPVTVAADSARLKTGRFKIEGGLWGRNLTDEAYLTSANPIDSLGVDLLTYSRPRSVGVFLRYNY